MREIIENKRKKGFKRYFSKKICLHIAFLNPGTVDILSMSTTKFNTVMEDEYIKSLWKNCVECSK